MEAIVVSDKDTYKSIEEIKIHCRLLKEVDINPGNPYNPVIAANQRKGGGQSNLTT
jgi:hypothetical protein